MELVPYTELGRNEAYTFHRYVTYNINGGITPNGIIFISDVAGRPDPAFRTKSFDIKATMTLQLEY